VEKPSAAITACQSCSRRVCSYAVLILLYTILPARLIYAQAYPVLDAKSAALGGVSVASDASAASFSNPALAAQNVENTNWLLQFPVQADVKTESDQFETNLAPGGTPVSGDTYREFTSKGLAIVIPDETLGGMLYFNNRFFHDAVITSGTDVVRHRAVEIQENGFAIARTMTEPDLPLYGFMVGATIKLDTYRAYRYDEATISNPPLAIDKSKYFSPSSAINFDLGIARELGLWKMGLVIKDLLGFNQEYSQSGETFRVAPKTRLGFSYQSRRTFWEFDVDLSKNTEIATQSESQIMAFGWEYRLIRPLYIRLGYNNNSVGDQLQTASAGIGIRIKNYQVDVASVKSDYESGTYAQFSASF